MNHLKSKVESEIKRLDLVQCQECVKEWKNDLNTVLKFFEEVDALAHYYEVMSSQINDELEELDTDSEFYWEEYDKLKAKKDLCDTIVSDLRIDLDYFVN